MKKIILSAIALMAFAFTNAQETRFGVKGGLNISSLVGGDVDDTKALIGFQVGGFAEIKIIERLSIQPELLFSTQGTKVDGFGGQDEDWKLNYINVPVLAKFYVTKQFTVEAGPQIGFLVSAKADGNDVKDSFKSVDLGFNFGAGYNFTDNFSAGIRYTVGLSNVLDYNVDDFDEYYDSPKNSNLALYAAYRF
ncbi:porin family protein [Flavobacterium quisquiliarum]|uniref:Porin family protein n=1 Tax=Flavobacterium quisquiliarum TaxID=1834436 RepID=A0ABV8WAU7_9FLAO|nr:porin family protein [Flavobacterium quisquiliarum]MBW1654003.1 outer membrane beta-barrel protein [Flavobacterium quisquiliarum]NWL04283.1 PorT family protein [Flavobacterium collinsii]